MDEYLRFGKEFWTPALSFFNDKGHNPFLRALSCLMSLLPTVGALIYCQWHLFRPPFLHPLWSLTSMTSPPSCSHVILKSAPSSYAYCLPINTCYFSAIPINSLNFSLQTPLSSEVSPDIRDSLILSTDSLGLWDLTFYSPIGVSPEIPQETLPFTV